MSKEIRLYQVSHQNFAATFKNVVMAESGLIIQLIKKHGGKWNHLLCQFEFQLPTLNSLIKDFKAFDQRLIIKDIPSLHFKNLLQIDEHQRKKCFELANSSSKRNRILVFDPSQVKRYEFLFKFLAPTTAKRQSRESYKRLLLICWENVMPRWKEVLQRAKVAYKQTDYQSFMPDECYKIACTPLLQHEVEILTYERLNDYLINKKVLAKYTSVLCDDIDIWLNTQASLYSVQDVGAKMRKILTQAYYPQKDLILIIAKLPLQKPMELLEICNILKCKQFGIDVFQIARNECNDATWIKKRYIKQNKFSRELYYLLQLTILVNLSYSSQPLQYINSYTSQIHLLQRFKGLDNRFKGINHKAILNSFQSQRLTNTYMLSQTSKLQQARYIKQRRDLMILDKLPSLTKYLFHVVKELNQRTILVIETHSTLQKVESFLIEQQIGHIVYEISCEQLKKSNSYLKYNNSESALLCILVRDKLLQEYRKCLLQYQKQLQEMMQMQAERELGITTGGLYELALHHKNKLNAFLFQKEQMLDLPKINSATHIIYLDTFWYEFSPEKENIVNNILDARQLIVVPNTTPSNSFQHSDTYVQTYKRVNLVKNFFVSKSSIQRGILQRYKLNLQAHEEEQKPKKVEEKCLGLQEFMLEQLQKHSKKCQGRRIQTSIYDIDEEYDRLQFQARKQKEQQGNKKQIPQYNTHIEGLIPQTPTLNELKPKYTTLTNQPPKQISLDPAQPLLNQIAWLKHDEESQYENCSLSDEGSIDLREYLVGDRINEQQSKKYFQSVKKVQRHQMQQMSDSFDESIHLDIKQESNSTVEKQCKPRNKKLIINEPSEVIQIDDQAEELFPLPIVSQQQFRKINNSYKFKPVERPQRHPSVPGLKLWGSKSSGNKKIARKYMSLKIYLTPNKSSLKGEP